uniref:Uncharacterized protein n=1 Tax=Meloidogyne enterolobii TaxID=390850 RepID=A0A6V7VGC2_MELEN|nr:unnamed protein product [Meloidogyne enterolobii]
MFTICCLNLPCKRSKESNKRKQPYSSKYENGLFSCSNEERRRLLITDIPVLSKTSTSMKNDHNSNVDELNKRNSLNTNSIKEENQILTPITQQKRNLIKSDFNINNQQNDYGFKRSITSNIAEQSPPPPRRLALPGGKTQVLPLTGGNKKRVPALVLLMADRENQRHIPQQDNRTNNFCETIKEDIAEFDQSTTISEGILSIDRTLISNSTATNDHLLAIPGYFKHSNNYMFRLSSPLPKIYTPPKYEIPPPSYSPPEPPTSNNEQEININNLQSNNVSISCSSYVINTTTTDSSALSSQVVNNNLNIIQKYLNNNEEKQQINNKSISENVDAEMETLSELDETSSPIYPHLYKEIDGLPHLIVQSLIIGGRVPRSISQQLEMMDEMSASNNK